MIRTTEQLTEQEQHMLECLTHDLINGSFFDKGMAYNEHTSMKHVDKTTTQLIDQMFEELKPNASSFTKKEDMQACVVETLLSKTEQIYIKRRAGIEKRDTFRISQVLSDEEFQGKGDEDEENNAVDFQTRHTGISLDYKTGRFVEKSTDVTSVVLIPSDETPYGIQLVTAYPDFNPNRDVPKNEHIDYNVYDTGRDLTEDMHATETYKDAVKRQSMFAVYLDETINPDRPYAIRYNGSIKRNGIHRYDFEHDGITAFIPTRHPQARFHVFMTPWDTTGKMYVQLSNGRYQHINMPLDGKQHKSVRLINPKTRQAIFQHIGAPEADAYISHIERKHYEIMHGRGAAKEMPSSLKSITDKWDRERGSKHDDNSIDY